MREAQFFFLFCRLPMWSDTFPLKTGRLTNPTVPFHHAFPAPASCAMSLLFEVWE